MYIYICIYVYTCIYICICICIYTYIYVYVNVYVNVYIYYIIHNIRPMKSHEITIRPAFFMMPSQLRSHGFHVCATNALAPVHIAQLESARLGTVTWRLGTSATGSAYGGVGWMISFPVDDFIEISKESIWPIWILPLKNHWFCSENDLPTLVFPCFFFHIYVNVYPVKVHPKGKDL